MNFTYENQGANTFLVYAMEENEQLDPMSVGMITNNDIPGLVKAVFTQLDTHRYIRYNVSSRLPVKQLFSGPINKRRLLGVFNGILEAMLSAEEYMIPPDMIVVDTDYMYTDVSTCETKLICLPIVFKEAQSSDLGAFFKHIMFTTQFDQAENCDYVAKIINYLNSAVTFSPAQFKRVLNEIGAETKAAQALQTGAPAGASAPKTPAAAKAQQVQPAPTPTPEAPKPQAKVQAAAPIKAAPARPAGVSAPPPAPPAAPICPPMPAAQSPAGESISLFYLLQHYNKENAQRYRAQKEAKKAGGQKPPKAAEKKKASRQQPTYQVPGFTPPAPAAAPQPPQPVTPLPQSSAPSRPTPPAPPAPPQAPAVPAPTPFGDFGDTSFCFLDGEDSGGTVILGQEQPTQQLFPHLIRKSNQEKIPINKPIFRLGRDASFNDYVVTNPAVGHSHCYIVIRDNEYFVVDSNSKNHTKVDGAVIPSGQEVKLSHGCALLLANEEFEFRLF